MEKSSKESSTSDLTHLRLPTLKRWLQELKINSNKCKKYGSFLPAQQELLRQIHSALSKPEFRVVALTAPPASGKTHIIALCASYFHDHDVSTCIVTPNNELRFDFRDELAEVNYGQRSVLPIINIGTFVRRRHDFELAFVDEAHNLRSAIELDRDIVRCIHLEKGEALYDSVVASLEKDLNHVTKELNVESAHDILSKMKGSIYERQARHILKTLSQWRTFSIVCGTTCDLKFLIADPERRNLVPKGKLFLFSATLLDPKELQFYCNIPGEMVQTSSSNECAFVPKRNIAYRYVACKSDYEKKNLAMSLLENTKLRTLILVNSNATCLQWKKVLSKRLLSRVITIPSGLNYAERLGIYKKFMKHQDSILLTSSSVYWEGISVKGLKFLIIPNPPFPQPSLLEIAEGKHTQYGRIARRRLIQGMGRVGRTPLENGMCLLLFKPSGLATNVRSTTKDKARKILSTLHLPA